MLIEIKGVQFVNKGAELMLYAILDKVKTTWPGAEICMEPDQNSPYIKRAQIGAYQKVRLIKNRFDFNGLSYFLPKRLRQFLKQTLGVVTEADVDMVLDASGFLYGDQWNYLPLKQSSSIAKRFRDKNKAYVLMPQALGPFTHPKYQSAAKVLVENARLVFARDEASLEHVQKLTSQSNTILAPDFTNLLTPPLPEDYQHLIGQVAIIPNSKMISHSNKNHDWRTKYVDVLVAITKAAQNAGQTVFLLNHEGKGDQAICESINQALSEKVDVVEPDSCLAIKAIIGNCAWVVSSRYHGCVSALSQSIPCLGTSWSHKYEALFADYGHKDWLIDIALTEQSLHTFVEQFNAGRSHNHDSLTSNVNDIKVKAETVWATIFNTLKSYY